MFTREQQKENAVKYLERIGCYKPYLKAFKDKGIVTMYESFGGYYVTPDDEPELFNKIKEVEERLGGTVYAVIHNLFEFGECYTMLWSGKYEEDEPYSVEDWDEDDPSTHAVFAWVWNKSCDDYSEFGTVGIKAALGGLLRIA